MFEGSSEITSSEESTSDSISLKAKHLLKNQMIPTINTYSYEDSEPSTSYTESTTTSNSSSEEPNLEKDERSQERATGALPLSQKQTKRKSKAKSRSKSKFFKYFSYRKSNNHLYNQQDEVFLWIKESLKGYPIQLSNNFLIENWIDGLAFCALIAEHRPDLIDFSKLQPSNRLENLDLAFDIAEEELGIAVYLDGEDLVEKEVERKSIYLQLLEFYEYFSKFGQKRNKNEKNTEIQKNKNGNKETVINNPKTENGRGNYKTLLAREREFLKQETIKKLNKYQLKFVTTYENNKETNPKAPYYSIQVEDPEKTGTGRNAYISYNIRFQKRGKSNSIQENNSDVGGGNEGNEWFFIERRFSDFYWLNSVLSSGYPQFILPPLPEKSITKKFQGEFRKRAFQRYLVKLNNHPIFSLTPEVETFFGNSDSKQLRKMKKRKIGDYSDQVNNKIRELINTNESDLDLIKKKEKKFPEFTQKNQQFVKNIISKIYKTEQTTSIICSNIPELLTDVIKKLENDNHSENTYAKTNPNGKGNQNTKKKKKEKEKHQEYNQQEDYFWKTFSQCLFDEAKLLQTTSENTRNNLQEPMLEYSPQLKKISLLSYLKKLNNKHEKLKRDYQNKSNKSKKAKGEKQKKSQSDLKEFEKKLKFVKKDVQNNTKIITGELKQNEKVTITDYRAMLLNFMIEKYTLHNSLLNKWSKVLDILSKDEELNQLPKNNEVPKINNFENFQTKSESETEPETDTDSGTGDETDTGTKTESDYESQSQSQSQSQSESESESQPQSENGSNTESESNSYNTSESRSESESESESVSNSE